MQIMRWDRANFSLFDKMFSLAEKMADLKCSSLLKFQEGTQSGLIRNGPIRNTSEILALFKK